MSNRFDLEQKIFSCWNIVDDLTLLRENVDNLDADQLDNFLLGLHAIYSVKFEELFRVFESSLKNRT